MADYTPFKMKGSPMQRNFGIGSPAKQGLKKEGKEGTKKTFIGPTIPMVDKDKDKMPDFIQNPNQPEIKSKTEPKPPRGEGKTPQKNGGFGEKGREAMEKLHKPKRTTVVLPEEIKRRLPKKQTEEDKYPRTTKIKKVMKKISDPFTKGYDYLFTTSKMGAPPITGVVKEMNQTKK